MGSTTLIIFPSLLQKKLLRTTKKTFHRQYCSHFLALKLVAPLLDHCSVYVYILWLIYANSFSKIFYCIFCFNWKTGQSKGYGVQLQAWMIFIFFVYFYFLHFPLLFIFKAINIINFLFLFVRIFILQIVSFFNLSYFISLKKNLSYFFFLSSYNNVYFLFFIGERIYVIFLSHFIFIMRYSCYSTIIYVFLSHFLHN